MTRRNPDSGGELEPDPYTFKCDICKDIDIIGAFPNKCTNCEMEVCDSCRAYQCDKCQEIVCVGCPRYGCVVEECENNELCQSCSCQCKNCDAVLCQYHFKHMGNGCTECSERCCTCGKKQDRDNMSSCDSCHDYTCDDCLRYCDHCDKHLCSGCEGGVGDCVTCNYSMCENCYNKCDVCEGYMHKRTKNKDVKCTDHRSHIICSDCEATDSCATKCESCGKDVCISCWGNNQSRPGDDRHVSPGAICNECVKTDYTCTRCEKSLIDPAKAPSIFYCSGPYCWNVVCLYCMERPDAKWDKHEGLWFCEQHAAQGRVRGKATRGREMAAQLTEMNIPRVVERIIESYQRYKSVSQMTDEPIPEARGRMIAKEMRDDMEYFDQLQLEFDFDQLPRILEMDAPNTPTERLVHSIAKKAGISDRERVEIALWVRRL